MNMILTLLSMVILISYVIAVCKRWGVPASISQSWFDIKRKWIFSVVVAVCLGLMFNPLMMVLPDIWQWIGFLMVAGGLLVAFAPNLSDDMEEKVHMTGAIIMGVASQVIVVVQCPLLLMVWLLWGHYWYLSGYKKGVFWAEMIGGFALYVCIIGSLWMR